MRGFFGPETIVVFLPGCCGDITQVDNLSPYVTPKPEQWARMVGGRVGAEAVKVLLSVEPGPVSPVVSKTVPPPVGGWLVFADQKGLGDALAERLQVRGASCLIVRAGDSYQRVGSNRYQMNPARPHEFRQLLADALPSLGSTCRGLVYLWGLDTVDPAATTLLSLETDQQRACGGLLYLAQALSAARLSPSPRVWVATRGVQPIEGGASSSLAQGSLWGLGRTIRGEQSTLWGGMIDLDGATSVTDSAEQLSRTLLGDDGEDQVAFRRGECYVARLARWHWLPGVGVNHFNNELRFDDMNTTRLRFTFKAVCAHFGSPGMVKAFGVPGLFDSRFGGRNIGSRLSGVDGEPHGDVAQVEAFFAGDFGQP